jgi:hypothetical protein
VATENLRAQLTVQKINAVKCDKKHGEDWVFCCLCWVVNSYWCLGGAECLHIQGQVAQELDCLTLCARPGVHKSWSTEFCVVVPNICVSSVWNLLHFTLQAPIILRWLLGFCIPALGTTLLQNVGNSFPTDMV